MPIHEEVLRAASRLCRERDGWTFSPGEVVRALPHLNERSVRTHIVSRCCINAPKNHPHKWAYFRRTGRARYEILPTHRKAPRGAPATSGNSPAGRNDRRDVAEPRAQYAVHRQRAARDTIHAVLLRDEDTYVAECLEIAVVTQGRTLDEVISNLREAIALHLEGDGAASAGLSKTPRLLVTFETPVAVQGRG